MLFRRLVLATLLVSTPCFGARPDAPQDSRPAEDGPSKPRFGVVYYPGEIAASGGIHVRRVVAGGPAESAGVKPGDVILSVGGARFTNGADLIDVLQERPAGGPIGCSLLRDGRLLEVTVDVNPAMRDNEAIVEREFVETPASRASIAAAGAEAVSAAEARLAAARELIAIDDPTEDQLVEARAHLDAAAKLLVAARMAVASVRDVDDSGKKAGRTASEPAAPSPRARRFGGELAEVGALSPPRPKSVADRATELMREGNSFEQIETILRREFQWPVVIEQTESGAASRKAPTPSAPPPPAPPEPPKPASRPSRGSK